MTGTMGKQAAIEMQPSSTTIDRSHSILGSSSATPSLQTLLIGSVNRNLSQESTTCLEATSTGRSRDAQHKHQLHDNVFCLSLVGHYSSVGGLIRLVISLECFIEITPDFLCPFMND